MKKIILFLLISSFFIAACKKENTNPQPVVDLESGVFILNQGNFTAGNASLSYFQNEGDKLFNNLFYEVNGVPLGDVAQSITIDETVAYIVVNNSGFIYKIDSKSVKYQAKISGFTSPRYMTLINDNKAYVSDLYSTAISIVDLNSESISGAVELGRSTEEMVLIGNEVFAANWSGYGQTLRNDKILIINSMQDNLVDSISVGLEPNSMVVDKEGHLWVLCSGGYLNEEIPTLWKIDPASRQILTTFTFQNINTSPDNLEINGSGDSLLFLNKGVFRMAISDASLPVSPLIEEVGNAFFLYLGVDPENSHIYVSDALDYSQNGYVYRYSPKGNLMESLSVGIIPGPFGFNYN